MTNTIPYPTNRREVEKRPGEAHDLSYGGGFPSAEMLHQVPPQRGPEKITAPAASVSPSSEVIQYEEQNLQKFLTEFREAGQAIETARSAIIADGKLPSAHKAFASHDSHEFALTT